MTTPDNDSNLIKVDRQLFQDMYDLLIDLECDTKERVLENARTVQMAYYPIVELATTPLDELATKPLDELSISVSYLDRLLSATLRASKLL